MLSARKFGVSLRSSSTLARVRHVAPVDCPAGTESRYQTLCVSLAAVYDVIMMSRREAASKKSIRDITTISCYVGLLIMKLPHALRIFSTVFVKKCMRLHFSR